MTESPQKGRIRFVGNTQGSLSQALYLTSIVAGALIALGFVVQALLPEGPFGLGPNWWFLPTLASPSAGFYYWSRAFRKDIIELLLESTEDWSETSLTIL